MTTTFADRLNRLFDVVCPLGRGPFTSAEVLAELRRDGVRLSAPYLSQLRSGARVNPSHRTIMALAEFFRVSPLYFDDDNVYARLDEELTALAGLRDRRVRRAAAGLAALPAETRDEIAAKIDELRQSG